MCKMEEVNGISESDEGGTAQHRNEIQSKFSVTSFEDLQKVKERLGTKCFKEACYGVKNPDKKVFKRTNKNRPREVSSKIKPKLEFTAPKQTNVRDPRFDAVCGSFDRKKFEKHYGFINAVRDNDKKQLRKLLKEEEDEVQARNIKYLLERMENQDRERMRRKKKEDKSIEEKREHMKDLRNGKKPHFKTKFEKKVNNMVERYQELKESGKLMKYIEKKQKKIKRKGKPFVQ